MEDVVHIAEMLVQMNVLVARLHVDLDVLTAVRAVAKAAVKQIVLMTVLPIVPLLVGSQSGSTQNFTKDNLRGKIATE